MEKTYIMVWIEEEEKWYYFIDSFDEEQFKDGYVDYYTTVDENNIIIENTYCSSFNGKELDLSFWKDCK